MMSAAQMNEYLALHPEKAADIKDLTKNLYGFYRKFVAKSYVGGNVRVPHIKKLSLQLEKMHHGEFNKLCVAMPPRHSKSSLVTLAFPTWLIFQNPNLRILIVNAEASLSENFGIRLRELIKSYGAMANVYLSDVKHSSTHLMFENSKGKLYQGSIRLVGASGSITGQDADYLIIDDPYKGADDITPTLLQKKIEWFKTLILQRLEPTSKLIILHTRWHSDDLQGYLQEHEPEDYKFIQYSAIQDDGTALWPQRYSVEYFQKQQKSMGERLFQSLYQQTPLDLTSDFFNLENLHWDETYIEQYNIANCRSYDMAYTDEQTALENNLNADYTAGVYAEKVSEDHYIFSDFLYKRLGKENIRYIQRNAKFDGTSKPILIETGTKGGAAKELFRLWDEDYLPDHYCKQSEPIGSKADRATPLADAMYDGKIHIYCPDMGLRKILKTQLESFPNGKAHKDLIDAMAHAYNYLKDKGTGRIVAGGTRKHIRRR